VVRFDLSDAVRHQAYPVIFVPSSHHHISEVRARLSVNFVLN
jgi:hypothetical protein